jgi:lipoprotein-anchoring transpeptidase ErfK/SrfK
VWVRATDRTHGDATGSAMGHEPEIEEVMMQFSRAHHWAGAVLSLALLPAIAATSAQAQSWFGGANSTYDRQVVSFPKSYAPGQLIVSFGDRRLYHIIAKGKAISYPIAVPRPDARWQGTVRISAKKVNPPWTPTAAMRRENPKLPAFVPGGDRLNPLGNRALYLGSTLYRIHGTDAPWTIGRVVSHGCVRMHNAHVAELFDKVHIGTRVVATWKRFDVGAVASYSSRSSEPSPNFNPFSVQN